MLSLSFFIFYKFLGDWLYRPYRSKRISIPTVDFTTMYYMLKTHMQTLDQQKAATYSTPMQDEKHKNNPKSIIPVPTTKQSYQRLYAKEKQQKVWI